MRWWRNECHTGHRIAQPGNQVINLAAGKLTAFSRLGSLGHLDLQHFGIDQVGRCNPKTPRGNLLDLGVAQGAVTRRILAPLTGVGTPSRFIHRLRQHLVGLG